MVALQWHRRFRSQARRNVAARTTHLSGRKREKIPKVVSPPPGGGGGPGGGKK